MTDGDWLRTAGVLFVVGKGGVGRTTVTAAAALAAAREGADVLVIAVDERPDLGVLLGGRELDGTERVLHRTDTGGGRVRGRTIPGDQAFGDYLEMKGVGGMLRRAASAASLPMIAAATPGLEHLLVLGKIKELERDGVADLILVDAPPAGHTAPFLRSATGLSDVVQSGPIRDQAIEVDEMLRDEARCAALVVTLAEETPVNEAIELVVDLRDDIGLDVSAAVVNACWPDRPGLAKSPAMAARSHRGVTLSPAAKVALASSGDFGRRQLERQHAQIERLATSTELPILGLPRIPSAEITTADVVTLAEALGHAPAVMSPGRSR
jgi:arsenite-transporting ATPase